MSTTGNYPPGLPSDFYASWDRHVLLANSSSYLANPAILQTSEWTEHKHGKILREVRTGPVTPGQPAPQYIYAAVTGVISESFPQLSCLGNFKADGPFKRGLDKAKYQCTLKRPSNDPVHAQAYDMAVANLKVIVQRVCAKAQHLFVEGDQGEAVRLSKKVFEKRDGTTTSQADPNRWPVPEEHRAAFAHIVQSHDIQVLPVFDEQGRPVPPELIESVLPGCLVEAYVRLIYFKIYTGGVLTHAVNADIAQLLIRQRAAPPPERLFSGSVPYQLTHGQQGRQTQAGGSVLAQRPGNGGGFPQFSSFGAVSGAPYAPQAPQAQATHPAHGTGQFASFGSASGPALSGPPYAPQAQATHPPQNSSQNPGNGTGQFVFGSGTSGSALSAAQYSGQAQATQPPQNAGNGAGQFVSFGPVTAGPPQAQSTRPEFSEQRPLQPQFSPLAPPRSAAVTPQPGLPHEYVRQQAAGLQRAQQMPSSPYPPAVRYEGHTTPQPAAPDRARQPFTPPGLLSAPYTPKTPEPVAVHRGQQPFTLPALPAAPASQGAGSGRQPFAVHDQPARRQEPVSHQQVQQPSYFSSFGSGSANPSSPASFHTGLGSTPQVQGGHSAFQLQGHPPGLPHPEVPANREAARVQQQRAPTPALKLFGAESAVYQGAAYQGRVEPGGPQQQGRTGSQPFVVQQNQPALALPAPPALETLPASRDYNGNGQRSAAGGHTPAPAWGSQTTAGSVGNAASTNHESDAYVYAGPEPADAVNSGNRGAEQGRSLRVPQSPRTAAADGRPAHTDASLSQVQGRHAEDAGGERQPVYTDPVAGMRFGAAPLLGPAFVERDAAPRAREARPEDVATAVDRMAYPRPGGAWPPITPPNQSVGAGAYAAARPSSRLRQEYSPANAPATEGQGKGYRTEPEAADHTHTDGGAGPQGEEPKEIVGHPWVGQSQWTAGGEVNAPVQTQPKPPLFLPPGERNLNDTRADTPAAVHDGPRPAVDDEDATWAHTPMWAGAYGDVAQSFHYPAGGDGHTSSGSGEDLFGNDSSSNDTTSSEGTESSRGNTVDPAQIYGYSSAEEELETGLVRYVNKRAEVALKRKPDFEDDDAQTRKARRLQPEGDDDDDE